MMQHITCNEYLSALLSEEVVSMLIALLDIFHGGPIYVEEGRGTRGLNLPPLVILLKALHFRFPPLFSRIPPFSPFSSAKYKTSLSTFPLFIPLLALLVLPPPALSSPVSRTPPVHCAPWMGTGGRGNSEKIKAPTSFDACKTVPWVPVVCSRVRRLSCAEIIRGRPQADTSSIEATSGAAAFREGYTIKTSPQPETAHEKCLAPRYSDRPYIERHL